jgi:hypothetical protein
MDNGHINGLLSAELFTEAPDEMIFVAPRERERESDKYF